MNQPYDSTVRDEARKWIDSLDDPNGRHGNWRLQIISQATAYSASGEALSPRPLRIRRFARGIPWAYFSEAVRYLVSLAPYRDITLNGAVVPGEYRPTRTYWDRDGDTVVSGSDGGRETDGTYTLVQDLVEASVSDRYLAASGGSCSDATETTWVWDASSVEDLPAPSQGVSYSIQAVGRGEDGLFQYALVKHVAKTQHGLPFTVSSTALGATVTVETWNNLYGTPPSFTDESGNAMGVPASSSSGGVTVSTEVTENDDCTYRAVSRRTVSLPFPGARAVCGMTLFVHDHQAFSSAMPSPLPDHAPAAVDGVTHEFRSDRREDGSYDNVDTTKTELPVLNAKESWTVGLTGVVHTTEHDNQPKSAIPADPGKWTADNVGRTVRVERTPGDLVNITDSQVDRDQGGIIAVECSRDYFLHTDGKRVSGGHMPQGAVHVEAAGGGKYRSRNLALRDDGTLVTDDSESAELTVHAAVEQYRRTVHGVIHTVTDRNMPMMGATAPAKVGGEDSVSVNKGGSVDHTTTEVSPNLVGHIANDGQSSVLEVDASFTNNVGGEVPPVDIRAVGFIYSSSCHLTEIGTWDYMHGTRQALDLDSGEKYWNDTSGKHTRRTYRHQKNPIMPPDQAIDSGYRSSASFSINEFGLFDGYYEINPAGSGDTTDGTIVNGLNGFYTQDQIGLELTTPTYDEKTQKYWVWKHDSTVSIKFQVRTCRGISALAKAYANENPAYNGTGVRTFGLPNGTFLVVTPLSYAITKNDWTPVEYKF